MTINCFAIFKKNSIFLGFYTFSKIDFQTNMIFYYYAVGMHFWKKYFFIPNINEIYVVNIIN